MFFMVAVGSALELLGVTIFMPFIEIITDQSKIHSNRYLRLLYERLGFHEATGFLAALAGFIIFIYIVKNAYLIFEKNILYKFTYGIQQRISVSLLSAYMKEPYTFHLNKNIAVLQRSLQEDTDQFTKAINHVIELSIELLVCTVLGVYLFIVSKSITIIVLVILVVLVGGFTLLTKKITKALGLQNQKLKAELYQGMNQALGGIKEVKVLGRGDFFIDRYRRTFDEFIRGQRKTRLLGILPKYCVEATCMTGLLAAIIVKLYFGQKDLIAFIPQLAVFAVAAFRMMPSVGRINEYITYIVYETSSVDLVYHDLRDIEQLDLDQSVRDESWKLKDRIAVRHVSYHYPDIEECVIEDASFDLQKGKTIAFVGSSGAGKTTMADIILGLLVPQKGHIYADDLDVMKNLRTWQKEIGYIPQVIYLSDDTIRNNIAFGVPEEEIDEAKVQEAAEKAQLSSFIETLPDGFDSYVGDRGVRLSGGQRQRIGIARAMYHDPEVLVLDEATSALDNETENAVMESIDRLRGQKTLLIIAHRLSTIRNADVIYEVSGGRVTERTKEEVLGGVPGGEV